MGSTLLLHLLLPLVLLSLTCKAQKLVQEEVSALKQIGAKLKKDWDFSVDPCSNMSGWVVPSSSNSYIDEEVTCNCPSTMCHVVSITLNGQNLSGQLPDEFASLTQLQVLNLKRNYLNGTLPVAWASLPLINISLLGNRISGRIPDEFGNISTLMSLELDDNQLQGPIPASFGKLINLCRLHLSGNNFSGELPDLGNLKNMTDFRIDGSPISGKVPSFIGNWTQLWRLDMLGTSMEGPFPPIFATLSSLTQLSVSDWKGGDGNFPPLQNMKSMRYLYLRNLSISGQLPEYIGTMDGLDTLDLSFNNLSGSIPSSFENLQSTNYIFLSNNMLQGSIPSWILNSKFNLDISYNRFTGSPTPTICQQGNVNMISSFSSTDSNSISPCLRRNFPCPTKPKNYNLFINCGGGKVTSGGNEYEDDSSPLGVSRYTISDSNKWASSSTGTFLDYHNEASYIATNATTLDTPDPNLYTSARLSPVSLKYYGLCLRKGEYNVSLHFAEIVFTSDQTFSSVGTRLFDVSIQGKTVLHDFNIAEEANGTGKEIIKTFNVSVDGTLEIHLYWTGQGTTAIPERSTYGPLISAISVTPNFNPDDGRLHLGAILGIVAGSACMLILLLLAIFWIYLRRRNSKNNEFKEVELQTGRFSMKQIKAATKHFDPANKIGEGGFGPVFKGVLQDGSKIAVKQLSSKSRQGNREFVNEIGMISALEHPNLVKLYGCCIEGDQLLLIYEYMENNSLSRALLGPENARLNLDWRTRHNICLGIAKGLAFLHEESRLKIIHRDIKSTNILLDSDLKAKISDFGLAKLHDGENTHITTRIAGTFGYMAPEYAMRGYLTDKADVYSFGIVMLEIISGTANSNYKPQEDLMCLIDWANVLAAKGNLLELVDPNILNSSYSSEEALRMLNLVLVCTSHSPTARPPMSAVVRMLEGEIDVPIPVLNSPQSIDEDELAKSFKKFWRQSHSSSFISEGSCTDHDSSMQNSMLQENMNSSYKLE